MAKKSRWWLPALTAAGILTQGSLYSLPVDILDGKVNGNFDTTITYGVGVRTEKPEHSNIGIINGGTYPSTNEDDGNLNYNQFDLYSHAIKTAHELELAYEDWSFFTRFTLLFDHAINHGNPRRTPHNRSAKGRLGASARWLDLYLQRDAEIGDQQVMVRVGEQVLNWGESTFIQNGLNVINPVDISKLRTAGAEIRDALLPVPMIRMDWSFNQNLALTAFWQWHFRETDLDPKGTFFSTNDFISPGGHFATITSGTTTDNPPPALTSVARAADRNAKDTHQGGARLTWFSPDLNNTEFGLYAAIYGSRLPLVSAFKGAAPLYPSTSNYFVEYPDHIVLLGASFNTLWKDIAIQGEYSLKVNHPLQIDDAQILLAGLGAPSQLGTIPDGTEIRGWKRKNISQAQVTFTKSFGPMWKSDDMILLVELGATKVHNMESRKTLHYEAPGSPKGNRFADRMAAGYRLLVRNQFNQIWKGIDLTTTHAFSHDLFGTLPAPITIFVQDRMQWTTTLEGRKNEWSAKASYTRIFNGGARNLLRDRDFLTLSASYAF